MSDDQHIEYYYREKGKVLDFKLQTEIERDKTVIQLSALALTLLATLGKAVLSANPALSVVIVVLFVLTIVLQMTGFWTTASGAQEVAENMDRNIKGGRKFFDPNYTQTSWMKLNSTINIVSTICFVGGFITLTVLIIIQSIS